MYEIKKIRKVFTSKFVGTGPSSYEKRIYRAAVSQRLRNTALEIRGFLSSKCNNRIQRHLIPLVTAMTTSSLIASSRLNLRFCTQIQRRARPIFLSRLIVACKWEWNMPDLFPAYLLSALVTTHGFEEACAIRISWAVTVLIILLAVL